MNSCIVGKGQRLDLFWSFLLGFKWEGSQHIAKGAVEPLCATIAHGVMVVVVV